MTELTKLFWHSKYQFSIDKNYSNSAHLIYMRDVLCKNDDFALLFNIINMVFSSNSNNQNIFIDSINENITFKSYNNCVLILKYNHYLLTLYEKKMFIRFVYKVVSYLNIFVYDGNSYKILEIMDLKKI